MHEFDRFKGKSVFVTGHTGFKGSWLALWLSQLGAKVTGYSLEPPTSPNMFEAARVLRKSMTKSILGDIKRMSGRLTRDL